MKPFTMQMLNTNLYTSVLSMTQVADFYLIVSDFSYHTKNPICPDFIGSTWSIISP